jgi:hypothetical protein
MTAVAFNIFSFHYIINKKKKPVLAEKLVLPPPSKPVDF